MLWFRRSRQEADRLEALATRLVETQARVAAIEADRAELRQIVLEWEDWYNKFRSLYGRLNKRAQRDEAPPEPAPQDEPINPAALKLLQPYGRAG